jgi:hypothetical protein
VLPTVCEGSIPQNQLWNIKIVYKQTAASLLTSLLSNWPSDRSEMKPLMTDNMLIWSLLRANAQPRGMMIDKYGVMVE